jgi:hypothetical protein
VTASGQPATPAAGPGQYEYVKVIEEQRGANGMSRGGKTVWQECDVVQAIRYWVAPDGSGRMSAGGGPSCGFPTSARCTG